MCIPESRYMKRIRVPQGLLLFLIANVNYLFATAETLMRVKNKAVEISFDCMVSIRFNVEISAQQNAFALVRRSVFATLISIDISNSTAQQKQRYGNFR